MTIQYNPSAVFQQFYNTERAGCVGLSDGGGPFGFDIHAALCAEVLISSMGCDAIFETGCFLGDTTSYLSRRYEDVPVLACDVAASHAAFTGQRLKSQKNVTIAATDSPEFLTMFKDDFDFPFFYLDAHGNSDWPLFRELAVIRSGVICIDDFDIGHQRFAFDSYDGIDCGPDILPDHLRSLTGYFTLNPVAAFPYPCLQIGRRGGKAFFILGKDVSGLMLHPWFMFHGFEARA